MAPLIRLLTLNRARVVVMGREEWREEETRRRGE
jgi:hypothetical protein